MCFFLLFMKQCFQNQDLLIYRGFLSYETLDFLSGFMSLKFSLQQLKAAI